LHPSILTGFSDIHHLQIFHKKGKISSVAGSDRKNYQKLSCFSGGYTVDLKVMNGLLTPKTVAIIGASSTPGKIGHTVVKNLIESKYAGKIYPVNPKADDILGIKCYPTVTDIPGEVDAAIMTCG
jgi:hypothetical protein